MRRHMPHRERERHLLHLAEFSYCTLAGYIGSNHRDDDESGDSVGAFVGVGVDYLF